MKKLIALCVSTSRSTVAFDLGLLALRLWFGVVMALAHGLPKFGKLEGFAKGLADRGYPMPELLAHLAATAELVGALLVAIGLLTRPSALTLVVTMAVAAFVQHAADPFAKQEFALAYGVAFFVLLVTGAGRISLDHLISKKLGHGAK
jgi:putative oxidoreductase